MSTNELPTRAEYDFYIAMKSATSCGMGLGFLMIEKFNEIAKKVKNITLPATEAEIMDQLKSVESSNKTTQP